MRGEPCARESALTPRPARGDDAAERRYISQQAAAEVLGVDVVTIRRWIAEGKITGYRLAGKLVRVDMNEIERTIVQVIPAKEDVA
jgi:excisionase family DNA binding protein